MNLSQPSSTFSQESSNLPAQNFNYAALNSDTQVVVQQHTREIKSLLRRTAQDIFDIGQKLLEVKAQLGHGHFRTWLKAEFDWSIWTATKFMQVADKFKCVNFTHLDIAPSALYELAAPSTPDTVRSEAIERALGGETITYSLAKTLKANAFALKEEPVQSQAESVTINISAETTARELLTAPETSNTIAEQILSEQEYQPSPSIKSKDDYSIIVPQLPNIDPGFLCTALLMNVEHLTHEQINALWQVLAQRTSFEQLALHNWSDSKLKRLTAAALAELNKRQ